MSIQLEDEAGKPTRGATVTLRGPLTTDRPTQIDGIVTFAGIPSGAYDVNIAITPNELLRSVAPILLSAGTFEERRCVVRSSFASISGQVRDASGAPVVGVAVTRAPLHVAADEVLLARADAISSAVSDAQGRFRITGLPAGEYLLETAPHRGFTQARQNAIAPSTSVVLVLHPERSMLVTGRVTDGDARPLAGAEVVTAAGAQARTDDAGRYRLTVQATRAPGATLAVTARRPGYTPQHKTIALPETLDTGALELSFRLDAATDLGSLLGALVDDRGAAIPGTSLYLQSGSRGSRHQAVTTPTGRFRFDDVPRAEDYVLRVHPTADYWDRTIEGVRVPGGGDPLRVVLERVETAMLNGTVVDALGAPVVDLTVWVRNLRQQAGAIRATTDRRGRFRAQVPAGDLVVETRALPKMTVQGLRVEPGQEFSVTLPFGTGERTVRGLVVLPDGAPVAGARVALVWARSDEGMRSSLLCETLTDASGRFAVPGLGPGRCTVTVRAVAVESARAALEIPPDKNPAPLRIELR